MIRIPIAGSETVPNQTFSEFQQNVRLQFFREVLGLWKKDREPCERIRDTNILYSWHSKDFDICWKCTISGDEANLLMSEKNFDVYLGNMLNELNSIIPSVQRKYMDKYAKDCVRLSAEYNKLTALTQSIYKNGYTIAASFEEKAIKQSILQIQREVMFGEYVSSWNKPWVTSVIQENNCLVFEFCND